MHHRVGRALGAAVVVLSFGFAGTTARVPEP
jgi:hypothetical protein